MFVLCISLYGLNVVFVLNSSLCWVCDFFSFCEMYFLYCVTVCDVVILYNIFLHDLCDVVVVLIELFVVIFLIL